MTDGKGRRDVSSPSRSEAFYIHSLIREGEHQQQDFKYRVEDPVKLARSVSAFANTDGGRLLIGVRDDGHISGVRSEEEIYVMHQAAYRYCRPEASIRFDTYHIEGHTVVIATVPPAAKKPIFALEPATEGTDMRQRAYIRIADENILASPVHLAIWHEEQQARGATFTYGDNEKCLMAAMSSQSTEQDVWLPLNHIVRRSRLPRPKAIALLSRLLRYNLVLCRYDGRQFVFALAS